MRVLSLFAGIGGLDLGLERAGFTIVGQVEIDPFCRAVLAKHWPNVPRLEDVRSVRGDEFGPVDLVCGGVPCQPASCAGKRKGAADDRWLWPEFVRVVRATGCPWFLAENVRGFLSLRESVGVVRELEGAGYEVQTLLLGARHVGAPHRRDRIWIVGHMADAGHLHGHDGGHRGESEEPRREQHAPQGGGVGHTESERRQQMGRRQGQVPSHDDQQPHAADADGMADPDRRGLRIDRGQGGDNGHAHQQGAGVADAAGESAGEPQHTLGSKSRGHARIDVGGSCGRPLWPARPGEPQHEWECPRLVYAPSKSRPRGDAEQGWRSQRRTAAVGAGESGVATTRLTQPALGVATDGLPSELPRWRRAALQAIGNAVVPQVAEVIGRAILRAHAQLRSAA